HKVTIVSASSGAILSQPNCVGQQSNPLPDDMECPSDKNPTDGTFFGCGRSYVQQATNKMRANLSKFNANGNFIWFKYLHKHASINNRMYPRDLIFVNSTHILLAYYSDDNC